MNMHPCKCVCTYVHTCTCKHMRVALPGCLTEICAVSMCALQIAWSGPQEVKINWQWEQHLDNVDIQVDCTCVYLISGAEAWWQTAYRIWCKLLSSDHLFIHHFCNVSFLWGLELSLWLFFFWIKLMPTMH